MMKTKPILKVAVAMVCLLEMCACCTQKTSAQNDRVVRWPEFLREWAEDYDVVNPQRIAIIDQIDTLYRLVEDGTKDTTLLCKKLCWVQEAIDDAIVHDSSLVFPLMMRATARNFTGMLANDRPSMLEAAFDCDCDVVDFMIADTWWYTSSRERFDIMYTTFMGQSWQAPDRFANLVLTKGDDSELTTAKLIVYNYTDAVIDSLQVTFVDSAGNVMERLMEGDTYTDTPDAGVKRMMVPPYLLMNALVANWTLVLSYDTPQGKMDMVGFPHIHFLKQVEDCPRLQAVLKEAMAE
jgi:hypothetical protein